MWNLIWPQAGIPEGSFYFDRNPNVLDQVLVNKNMATATAPVRALAETVQILRFPDTSVGSYEEPRPFGGMGKPVDQGGFSDHFPIGLRITEQERARPWWPGRTVPVAGHFAPGSVR